MSNQAAAQYKITVTSTKLPGIDLDTFQCMSPECIQIIYMNIYIYTHHSFSLVPRLIDVTPNQTTTYLDNISSTSRKITLHSPFDDFVFKSLP